MNGRQLLNPVSSVIPSKSPIGVISWLGIPVTFGEILPVRNSTSPEITYIQVTVGNIKANKNQ
jgi:hypothetical protein